MQLTDPGWESEHFDVLGPATSATYDVIEPGASERLEFVVVPRVSGQFSAGPSLVTYAAGKGPAISGTSNALPRIPILSITDKHIETAIGVGAVVTLGFLHHPRRMATRRNLPRRRRRAPGMQLDRASREERRERQQASQGHRGAHQGQMREVVARV